jgi:hypothetical protein
MPFSSVIAPRRVHRGARSPKGGVVGGLLSRGDAIQHYVGGGESGSDPRVANDIALKLDSSNHILQYCMSSNISGVIGSAVAAGVLISFLQ